MKKLSHPFAIALACSTALFGLSAFAADTAEIPNEGEIATILKTADRSEIEAARLAKSKAESADVKKFAKHMIKDHTKNEKEEMKVAKEAGIHPAKSDQAAQLAKTAKQETASLKKLKGNAFDNAYITQQVAMHQSLLSDLDSKFIPAAKTPELKAFLEKTRDHVQEHLNEAQKIAANTNSAASTNTATQ